MRIAPAPGLGWGRGLRTGPSASVTEAPKSANASATATPSWPDERFPMKRTESIGSSVGPAVTRTVREAAAPAFGRTASDG